VNALKPLLVVAVLGGIGYGVYTKINNGPDTPPAGVTDGWDAPPDIQLGEGAGKPEPFTPPSRPAFDRSPSDRGPSSRSTLGEPWRPSPDETAAASRNGSFDAPGSADARRADPPFTDRSAAFADRPDRSLAGQADATGGGPAFDPRGESRLPRDADRDGAARSSAAGFSDRRDPADAVAPRDPATGFEANSSGNRAVEFERALELARRAADGGQLVDAHRQLSLWYDNPNLSSTEQQQLNDLLDQVAGTVVYSTQSLAEPAYTVQPGERLEDVATRYGVTWQLLAKINGIDDPQLLQAGEQIKVLRGPFSAVISLERRQLTVFLDGLYAGRFALGVGRDYPPREGQYTVAEKIANPTYHGAERSIDADDPANPLGERWIGLGGNIGLHGSVDANYVGRSDLPGSIGFSPRDIDDLYDILGIGSPVVIQP